MGKNFSSFLTPSLGESQTGNDFWGRGGGNMKTASADEVRAKSDAFLKATDKGPVVVTRNAKPVVVMLSVKDPDEIERLAMRQSKKLRKILDKSRKQIAKGKGIPHDEFWRQVERMRKNQA